MQPFELEPPQGRTITGFFYRPKLTPRNRAGTSLIIALHAGTYTASYSYAGNEHSIKDTAKALGIPVAYVMRPGYGDNSIQSRDSNDTCVQQEACFFDDPILPAIWKDGGFETEATSILLLSHSVGAAVTIAAAACLGDDRTLNLAMGCAVAVEFKEGWGRLSLACEEVCSQNPPSKRKLLYVSTVSRPWLWQMIIRG